MPTFAGRPLIMSSLIRWNFCRIQWLDGKDIKYRSLQFDKFLHFLHSYVGRYDSQTKWLLVLIFHRKLRYGSTKWKWLIHWKNWSLRDQFVERIFQISRCWTRRLLLLWTRSSQNSHFKKKVSLEEQKAQKEDRFLRGRQIAFMIYDFRVTGAHDAVLDFADLFSVTLPDDNIQDFDTWWDEILLSMSKIPSDEVLENLYKLRIRQSAQLKTVLDMYDMEIHQKISMPN